MSRLVLANVNLTSTAMPNKGLWDVVGWPTGDNDTPQDPDASIWGLSYCSGAALRSYWQIHESALGVYDWSYFDRNHALATANGKKTIVEVVGGFFAPSYVLTDPSIQKETRSAPRSSSANCNGGASTCTAPYPWDANYLNAYLTFLETLINHFVGRGDPVCELRLTGIENGEMRYVTDDVGFDDALWWTADGYLPQTYIDGWEAQVTNLLSFVPKSIALSFGIYRVKIPTLAAGQTALETTLDWMYRNHPGEVTVQSNALQGPDTGLEYANQLITSYNGKLGNGFQESSSCTRNPTNMGGAGATPAQAMALTMNNALNFTRPGSRKFEVYEADWLNPDTAAVLQANYPLWL